MGVDAADLVVRAAAAYVALGTAFAVPFVIRWAGHVDARAREGSRGFRLLILPGVVLWWPLLASRLARRVVEPPVGWTAHRAAASRSGGEEERV